MKTLQQASSQKSGIDWMDNLRSIIIFLVVFYQVGNVYESAGVWGRFWIVDEPDTMTWVCIGDPNPQLSNSKLVRDWISSLGCCLPDKRRAIKS